MLASMSRPDRARDQRILELLEQASVAHELADEAALGAWGRSLKPLAPPEKYIALWAWSKALVPGPSLAPALSEVERWIRDGDEDDVRVAAMLIAWRARSQLAPVIEALAYRLAPHESPPVRLFCGHALYALAEAKVPIALAFPALFSAIETDHNQYAVAAFALGVAHKNGESFALAADWVARTLGIRWESANIYSDLLDSGFVPPPQHKQHLQELLYYSDEQRRRVGKRGLSALVKAGEALDDFKREVIARISARTAKEAERGLCAGVALVVDCGLPVSDFSAPLERALKHKTLAVRQAAHRAVAAITQHLTASDRGREQRAAEARGLSKLAELLEQEPKAVTPKASPGPAASAAEPPTLDVEALSRQLRSDKLVEVRTAIYRLARAKLDELEASVPALIDALATEERGNALGHLTRGVTEGLDLRFVVPIVAGLLLDRDYYDYGSLAEILRFLVASLERGYDITLAWPWVVSYLSGASCQNLRFQLAQRGLSAGLELDESLRDWLMRWFVDVDPKGHPSGVAAAIQYIDSAGACLAAAHRRKRLS